MSLRAFLPALLVLSAACSHSTSTDLPPGVLMRQDFDSLNGWNGVLADPATSLLSTAVAHSGRCSARVGGATEYGLGFQMPLGELIKKRPRTLEVSYWCYRVDAAGNAATVVCTVKRPSTNQQLLWQGADLSKEVAKDRQWTKITQRIDLPTETDFSDLLHIYTWRGAAVGDVYFDDLEVRAIPD